MKLISIYSVIIIVCIIFVSGIGMTNDLFNYEGRNSPIEFGVYIREIIDSLGGWGISDGNIMAKLFNFYENEKTIIRSGSCEKELYLKHKPIQESYSHVNHSGTEACSDGVLDDGLVVARFSLRPENRVFCSRRDYSYLAISEKRVPFISPHLADFYIGYYVYEDANIKILMSVRDGDNGPCGGEITFVEIKK